MSEFTATVIEFAERGVDHNQLKPPTTYGAILVRPPIEPGEHFKDVVLGRNRWHVNLSWIARTGRYTLFLAESSMDRPEDRREDINVIALRIGSVINNPEKVLELMEETPFPPPPADFQGQLPELELALAEVVPAQEEPLPIAGYGHNSSAWSRN